VLLAITAFSLTLLGTFIVRSGIIVSVHAFTTDPGRGSFILSFLAIVVGGSLLLYALRAGTVDTTPRYKLFSREVALWLNNLLLCVATLIVLLGTLLPMVHKELGMGTISIGVPFFNQMFFYLLAPFALLIGLGPMLRWKQNKWGQISSKVITLLVASTLITFSWLYTRYDEVSLVTLVGVFFAIWVVLTTGLDIYHKVINDKLSISQLGNSFWAMHTAHLGFACVVLGVTLTSAYSVEKQVRLAVGDTVELNDYRYRFDGVKSIVGPNYKGYSGVVTVFKDNAKVTELFAEKRQYNIGMQVMTEAAIDAKLSRDLYLALGEQLSDGAWALRIYEKPFVRLMWLGGLLMALAGLFVIRDKRYRHKTAKNTDVKGALV
jgi:cytochrome c-type biogenesis protein CcmF